MVAGCGAVVSLGPGWRVRCGVYLLGPFGTLCSGPSVPSARVLRRLPLGLRVAAAYPAWFLKNVARNSPASISDFEIVSLGLQRLRGVSKNDQVKLRATFRGRGLGWGVYLLGSFGAFRSGCAWRQPIPHGSSKMSHVIPWRVFQTLKSCRWDCNVCGVSRKMTKLNYVQLLGGRWVGAQLGARLGEGAQSQFVRASSSEPVQQRDVGERSGADAPQELAPAEQVDGDRHARGGQGHPPVVSRRVGVVYQRR